VIFLDASAAAKRYIQEPGSAEVNRLWGGTEPLASLALLLCELTSTLNRKRREHALPRGAYQIIKRQVGEDFRRMYLVPIHSDLIELSLRLLNSHPLRTLDALYLAGALGLRRSPKDPLTFVAADRQILHAAQVEGLRVLNPETQP